MKAIYKTILAAALATPLLTGCIEETFPTTYIIQEQLESSPKAVAALVWAMPGHMNIIGTLSSNYHFDSGYPSMLHIRDVMTEDMSVLYAGGYDWYASWSQNSIALGMDYLVCQYTWNFYYEQILTTNLAIGAIDPDVEDEQLNFYLGTALASRAFVYLDAARMYEFLPTEFNPGMSPEGNNILGLTMPIVTENTTEEEYTNNPRVSHNEMVAFIKKDLEQAIEHLQKGSARPEKTLPDLGVVYGLMARLYLWDASYQEEVGVDNTPAGENPPVPSDLYKEAAKYARLAINTSGAKPLTREQWFDKSAGFNDPKWDSWMFCGQYVTEDDAVQAGGIRTWASFNCNEQEFGYAAPAQGAHTEIGASIYGRIDNRDFRKLSWKAPDGHALAKQVPYIDADWAAENFEEPYISIKFRPGEGNMYDYTVGSCTAYPLMRVEEMYFIEAEATAHYDVNSGLKLLKDFMTKYRYAAYNTYAASSKAVIEEIIFQKRVELWGEGQSFFDIKRLNYSTTRWYAGTNFTAGANTFNTNGRAAWMNLVVVKQEVDNNPAIAGYNNPSPAQLYTPNR